MKCHDNEVVPNLLWVCPLKMNNKSEFSFKLYRFEWYFMCLQKGNIYSISQKKQK